MAKKAKLDQGAGVLIGIMAVAIGVLLIMFICACVSGCQAANAADSANSAEAVSSVVSSVKALIR